MDHLNLTMAMEVYTGEPCVSCGFPGFELVAAILLQQPPVLPVTLEEQAVSTLFPFATHEFHPPESANFSQPTSRLFNWFVVEINKYH